MTANLFETKTTQAPALAAALVDLGFTGRRIGHRVFSDAPIGGAFAIARRANVSIRKARTVSAHHCRGIVWPSGEVLADIDEANWKRVTPLDRGGDCATWIRLYTDEDGLPYSGSNVHALHIRSGKLGDELAIAIARDEPGFSYLLDIALQLQWNHP